MDFTIPLYRPLVIKDDFEFVAKVLEEGQVSGRAPVVGEFERKFAEFLGVKYALAVSSGTAALHVALFACGLTRRDKIIEPALTMMSTAFAASYLGAQVIPADVEDDYWCLDVQNISAALMRRSKAILVVHLYGNPARVDELREMAEAKNVWLVEDCSEAMGGRLNGKLLGTFGDVATFSFFANKLITTGEGGMIATDNEELAERTRSFRDLCFGRTNKFIHDGVGYNYRMSALQAALGLSQLRRADDLLSKKMAVAETYRTEFDGFAGLEPHPQRPNSVSPPWLYSVLVSSERRGLRDRLIQYLAMSGVEARPFFVPIHRQPVYAAKMRRLRCPVSESLSFRGINLPSSMDMSTNEVRDVVSAIKSGFVDAMT